MFLSRLGMIPMLYPTLYIKSRHLGKECALITRSKNDTTTSRRVVFRYLQNKYAVKALFGEVAEKVKRVVSPGSRK